MGNSSSSDDSYDYEGELAKQKDLKSVEVQVAGDSKDPSLGPIRRNTKHQHKLIEAYNEEGADNEAKANTVWWAFMHGAKHHGANNFLGTRAFQNGKRGEYVWQSYHEVKDEVINLALGLSHLGAKTGDRIGVCSANRAEWTEVLLATGAHSFVTVALYDSLGVDAMEYIINHAEVEIAFSSPEKMKNMLAIIDKCPKLKTIVQFDLHPLFHNHADAIKDADREAAAAKNVKLIGFSELLKLGSEVEDRTLHPGSPNDTAYIMYTSGTTGVPKGVILTHLNLTSTIAGALKGPLTLLPTDVHISYLPLAHIFESVVQVGMMVCGASIGFFGGDVRTLTDDLKLLQPTVFAGVPRVFQRIYERVMNTVKSAHCVGRAVFMKCLNGQIYYVRRGQPLNARYENFFATKVRGNVGLGRCRLIVTGAAPCPPYLMEFLRAVVNPTLGVCQGYGLTETSAAVTVSEPKDHTLGHVGAPLGSAEIRLRDVPEMNYLHTNAVPTGEILIRGPCVFKGYYKNEAATAEALTEDGWLCTGDVGRWNPNGTLSIIDRKKNIFKLAQGEYIAAEKIEQVYQKCGLIGQVWVYGNSYKSFVLAVIVPSPDGTLRLLDEKKIPHGLKVSAAPEFRAKFKELVEANLELVRTGIIDGIKAEAKKGGLQSFEVVKDIHLELELDDTLSGFTVANDTMTPSFKLRRPILLKKYEQQLRDLYTKHGEEPKPAEKW